MPKLIVVQGLPCSGKTTWINLEAAKRGFQGYIRVSRNEIKKGLTLSPSYDENIETLVSIGESALVRNGLRKGFDVYIDADNLNPNVIDKWTKLVDVLANERKKTTVELEIVRLNTTVDDCIARDEKRPPTERVGKARILSVYRKFVLKDVTEDDMNW